jgi:hypothetical protein
MNKDSSWWVTVPLVTERSCMASRSADCVFGVARFGVHEVGEDGAGLEAKRLMAVVVGIHDHTADNVGGHEVGVNWMRE